MGEVISYALALTARGYSCFPVTVGVDEDGDKDLRFPGPWGSGEYPEDPDEIRDLFSGYTGLVINTGLSGLVVLDIDTKHGQDGFAALKAAGVELPDTPVKARTPSGGEHWFYREGSVPVECSQSKIAAGVDIRARGGIVVGPPTEVPGYGQYEFLDLAGMVSVSELPEFPDSIAETLRSAPTKVRVVEERPALTTDQRKRMQSKFDQILTGLSRMEDGTRNASMRRMMIRLFGLGMTLGENPEVVAELARAAYYDSGGVAERELESFIEWASEHAQYEVPEEDTDEAFEAEVAAQIRKARVAEEAKARMNPVRVARVSDDDVLEFDPELGDGDWLISGVLPRAETVILFGVPTAGKSFSAIDLAMGAATGTQAWGEEIEQGRVLYLAGEGTRRLAVRWKAWEAFHGVQPDPGQVQYRKMRLILSSDESVAEHQELVRRLRPDLIIVDTMLRASEGLSLENPAEASRIIAQLDRVREANPGAALVVLHHPAKSNPDKPAGSYPIEGNVDTILKLQDEDGIRTLASIKSKENGSWRKTFELRGVQIPGTQLSSAVFVPSMERRSSPWNE
ncbi:AAA family ATPase [Amycolatopsis sp. NPDC059027]|uniref:AAA family ATPase n=1 Tax=Amycolatopsis sp. NPDC059027 TaxID=3346709 RepID=UPI00367318BB